MTNKEAIECIKVNICYKQSCCNDGICKSTDDRTCAIDVAIEALEKCEKIGTCKECGAADFCYNRKDACYCLRHNHIMYSDDTCNYFYKGDEDWGEEE